MGGPGGSPEPSSQTLECRASLPLIVRTTVAPLLSSLIAAMSVLLLSRLQFALTVTFHYLYPPLSIGLGLLLVAIEGLWLATRNPLYHQMARFWTKVFALTFSIGVATGIVMEFEFGTNWATYSRGGH